MLFLKVACSYCYVVEYAEPIQCIAGSRMMSRRSHNCEPIGPLSLNNVVHSLQAGSYCQSRSLF